MTPEQARIRARARLRLQQQGGAAQPAQPTQPPSWYDVTDPRVRQDWFDIKHNGESLLYDTNQGAGFLPLPNQEDINRSALNSAWLDAPDRARALQSGSTIEEETAKTEAARERLGPMHYATDVASSVVLTPGLGFARGLGYVGKGLGKAGEYAGRLFGYGAEGAATGAAASAIRGEDTDAIQREALTGGVLGTGGGAAGDVLGRLGRVQSAGKGGKYSDFEATLEAGKARYKAAEAANANYPNAIDDMLRGMEGALAKHRATGGYVASPALEEVNRIRTHHGGRPVEAVELDKIGQTLENNLRNLPVDTALRHDLRQEVGKAAAGPPPVDPLGVPRPDVQANVKEAGTLWGQGKRAEEVAEAEAKAQEQAHRGRDWRSALEVQRRGKLSPVLKEVKESKGRAGYSAVQQRKLEGIVKGTPLRNAAFATAKRIPSLLGVGDVMTWPLRGALNMATDVQIRDLEEMLRNGVDIADRSSVQRWMARGAAAATAAGRSNQGER